MTTQSTKLHAPWSLHFDRDGTEDIAVILDANGDELARSRHFWLPEGDDPIPPTLAAMKLVVAAPRILQVLQAIVDVADTLPFCPIGQVIEHSSGNDARYAIAEATGRAV